MRSIDIKDISRCILLYKNEIAMVLTSVIFFIVIKGVYSYYSLQLSGLDREAKMIEERKEAIEKYREAESEYKKSASRFFDNISLFRRFLEEKAEEHGISISYLHPSQTEREGLLEVKLSFPFISSYENLVKFLQSLEARNIKVESLRIKRTSSSLREVSIELIGFILKEKK